MRAAKIGRELPGQAMGARMPQRNKRGDNLTKKLGNYEKDLPRSLQGGTNASFWPAQRSFAWLLGMIFQLFNSFLRRDTSVLSQK